MEPTQETKVPDLAKIHGDNYSFYDPFCDDSTESKINNSQLTMTSTSTTPKIMAPIMVAMIIAFLSLTVSFTITVSVTVAIGITIAIIHAVSITRPIPRTPLEPIPPYHEEYTSFEVKMDSTLPEAEMVRRVFEAVVSALNGKDLCNNSSHKSHEHKNCMWGIGYTDDLLLSAIWKMKVYMGRTTGDNTVLLVEFQRRQGKSTAFHFFYNTLLGQKTILDLRKMKPEDAPTPCKGFMQPLPPPPMDWGDYGEAPQLTPEEQDRDDLKDMDEEAVKALAAWVSSEMVDQCRQALRVMANLTKSIPVQNAMVVRKMDLVGLLMSSLASVDDDTQRLAAIILAQCAANPSLAKELSCEFDKVNGDKLIKDIESSLDDPQQRWPLEYTCTLRHLRLFKETLLTHSTTSSSSSSSSSPLTPKKKEE